MSEYKHILDTLVTAIVVLDGNLRVRFINCAAQSLLHTSAAHADNLPLHELVLKADRIIPHLQHALAEGQSFTEREAAVQLPDNLIEYVDLTVSILELNHGQRQLLIELQPLNRLKQINKDEESIARQETARRLIGGLAHEVKNPLGGIRGAAQLLERELPSDGLKEYTGVIISEADRLKALVDRLLGPQRQISLAPVNIHRVLEHVVQLIEAEHPQFIEWQRDYDPSLPDLQADESQVIQAVINIVRNAYEAMAESQDRKIQLRTRGVRQFTIGTHRHRLVLALEIVDNGPGIDPELEERIFFPMISGTRRGYRTRACHHAKHYFATPRLYPSHQSPRSNLFFHLSTFYLPFTPNTEKSDNT